LKEGVERRSGPSSPYLGKDGSTYINNVNGLLFIGPACLISQGWLKEPVCLCTECAGKNVQLTELMRQESFIHLRTEILINAKISENL